MEWLYIYIIYIHVYIHICFNSGASCSPTPMQKLNIYNEALFSSRENNLHKNIFSWNSNHPNKINSYRHARSVPACRYTIYRFRYKRGKQTWMYIHKPHTTERICNKLRYSSSAIKQISCINSKHAFSLRLIASKVQCMSLMKLYRALLLLTGTVLLRRLPGSLAYTVFKKQQLSARELYSPACNWYVYIRKQDKNTSAHTTSPI